MPQLRYVFNPFTGNFDAIRRDGNRACIEGLFIGDLVEWTLPDGSKVYSPNLIGESGTVVINGVTVNYARDIGTEQLCVTVPQKADFVENVVLTDLECESFAVVGQPCREDPMVEGRVLVHADNQNSNWPSGVLGVIVQKLEPTRCNVMLFGTSDAFSGLTPGQHVFLGTDGLYTQTPPTLGVFQKIGRAMTSSKVFVNIGEKTVRT
jgi:hypothetical protein